MLIRLKTINCNFSILIIIFLNVIHLVLPLFIICELLGSVYTRSGYSVVIQCSSPSAWDKVVSSSNNTPEPNWSAVDKLLSDIKNNMNSITEFRLKEAEEAIENELKLLMMHKHEMVTKFAVKDKNLMENVMTSSLTKTEKHNLYDAFTEIENKEKKFKPFDINDRVAYWEYKLESLNWSFHKTKLRYNCVKNSIKDSQLSQFQKEEVYKELKEIRKIHTDVNSKEKVIYNKLINKSKIAEEIKDKTNK